MRCLLKNFDDIWVEASEYVEKLFAGLDGIGFWGWKLFFFFSIN